ncbi:MAG: hypothetical protein ACE5JE_05500 [Thermoplasmata archaeon]
MRKGTLGAGIVVFVLSLIGIGVSAFYASLAGLGVSIFFAIVGVAVGAYGGWAKPRSVASPSY